MAGRPGRSGGATKLSIQEHIRRGTLKPARHLGAVTSGLQRSAEPRRVEDVPVVLVAGLSELGVGKLFVETIWTDYANLTPDRLLVLREVGVVLDELEALRGQKGERPAQQLLLALLAALRFKD